MVLPAFRQEPPTDFSRPEARHAMQAALGVVRGELGKSYPLIIGGDYVETSGWIESYNPAWPQELVGRVGKADATLASQAIEQAHAAFEQWRRVPVAERAAVLFRAAAIMRRHKYELCAWLVVEVSKSWAEADADVAEAIDFCEYYAREALRLAGAQPLVPMPGEIDELRYIPLGVCVTIPPWNFALAIMAGMTVAALVTGNTVVLKPSSLSPVIAARFVRMLHEAGLPRTALAFCPGPGASVGDTLVDHPLTRMIAFTGSKEVGLRIFGRASVVQPGQKWLKRSILEMGGKDAIVVDETADLDAAAEAIVASAFGFQGQKCSACSRAIVVDAVYDAVLERVVERARTLTVGDPAEPSNSMGAVIDAGARDKIAEYIEIGKREGRLVLGGELVHDGGYFVPPTIVADVAPESRIAQEEIFGPVLAFVRARDFDDATAIFNGTEYGLTGALYSRDITRIARARDDFHVGNLYINRKCTGAMVAAHPFGGFNMSGTDSKAGGPDYLLLFTQAKSIGERL